MRHLQTDSAIVALNKQELSVDKKRESSSLFHFCLSQNKPGGLIRNVLNRNIFFKIKFISELTGACLSTFTLGQVA